MNNISNKPVSLTKEQWDLIFQYAECADSPQDVERFIEREYEWARKVGEFQR